MTNPPSVVTMVTLDTNQIQFLLDLMMGSQLGSTKLHAYHNNVDDSGLYNHLDKCLHEALEEVPSAV